MTKYTKYTITYKGKGYVKSFDYSEVTGELDEFRNREITKEDLYKITLWKVNRFPTIDDDVVIGLNSLRMLNSKEESKARNVLLSLLTTKGVRLPMASTYLRFVNPEVYQIIDIRAYRAAFDYTKQLDYIKASNEERIDIYFNYLKRLKKIAKEGYHGFFVEFENLDRFLYDVDKTAGYSLNEKPEYNRITIANSIKKIINNN